MRGKEERPAKCKRTRAEREQIEAVIRQAKGDGKNHTVQDSILFQNMFRGLVRATFSKTIAFEDVNHRLAGPEDQRRYGKSRRSPYPRRPTSPKPTTAVCPGWTSSRRTG